MKLIGLISPNLTEETLVDVYKVFPDGFRIEGRALKVGNIPMTSFIGRSKPLRTLSATWRASRWTF
jgi:hypothetical protein